MDPLLLFIPQPRQRVWKILNSSELKSVVHRMRQVQKRRFCEMLIICIYLYEQLSLSWINKTSVATVCSVCWLLSKMIHDSSMLIILNCFRAVAKSFRPRCGTTRWWWTHLVHFWRWWLERPMRSSWSSAGSWPNSPVRLGKQQEKEQHARQERERGAKWRVFHRTQDSTWHYLLGMLRPIL